MSNRKTSTIHYPIPRLKPAVRPYGDAAAPSDLPVAAKATGRGCLITRI